MVKRIFIYLFLAVVLVVSLVEPALAQKTSQIASKTEIIKMIVFTFFGMILLNYFKVP